MKSWPILIILPPKSPYPKIPSLRMKTNTSLSKSQDSKNRFDMSTLESTIPDTFFFFFFEKTVACTKLIELDPFTTDYG